MTRPHQAMYGGKSGPRILVRLSPESNEAVRAIAMARKLSIADLVRGWIDGRLREVNRRASKRTAA